MTTNKRSAFIFFFLLLIGISAQSQEMVVPMQGNPFMTQKKHSTVSQKQRATLPFVDDFSYKSSTPDPQLWEESQVFINNTFGRDVITQGVATFDGLNEAGRPYKPNDFSASGFADSLTCTPIDLSFRNPNDSIVLSFFLQPQGNGFAPEVGDSFYVFFRNDNNDWNEVWRRDGTGFMPFEQFFVSVNDPQYFHDSFQFRFVNFASLNLNDDVWNLDYVKLDVNRSHNDTTLNDLAFTEQPTSILNTYTAMPFRHFQQVDLSANQDVFLHNNYDVANNFILNHAAIEVNSSNALSNSTQPTFSMFAKSDATRAVPSYSIGLSGAGPHIVRNTYFIDAINGLDNRINDTIRSEVVFDNYFAYDDGTSELAYFLNPALNQPAKTAIKFELSQPDSVYGLSVFFAAQVPSAENKLFSIILYDSLGTTSSGDVILKQQDFFKVQYPAKRGEFSSYAFDQPIGLPAGTYYIGLQQPANSGSDSIYYGLDVNNDNNINVLSYNVNGFWFNSSVQGTVMMRPMVGAPFTPTSLIDNSKKSRTMLYPNPSNRMLQVSGDTAWLQFEIISMSGKMVSRGELRDNRIDLQLLPSGQYIIKLNNKKQSETHTIWKQ